MHHWAEAAIGRRQLARSLQRLELEGFGVRDVPGDVECEQQCDRLLVGPSGVYVVGVCMPPGNLWRSVPEPHGEALAGRARSTWRLTELLSALLRPDLARLGVGIDPLLTVIGPEQVIGARHGDLPLVGPLGLVDHVTDRPALLIPMQVDRLIDQVDDWLARRSVAGLHALARRHNVLT